jgi:2-succinyl-6-hydroxy-2,4-cyclohexadiene-1-carboxylate synthase
MISLAMDTRVVFVPGFMQRAEAWSGVADLLPERYPSTLLDHDRHDRDGRIEEIAAAGDGAVLCGYSLGGRLCLHAALADPGRYRALVIVGASAGIEDGAARSARAETDERLAAWMEHQPIEQVVAVWERQPIFADQSDALIDAQRGGRLAQDPRALAELLRTAGQAATDPVWDRLRELALPVLAIAGARDARYTETANRIAKAVPDGRARIVENAGHAPQLQNPAGVAAALLELLAGLPR